MIVQEIPRRSLEKERDALLALGGNCDEVNGALMALDWILYGYPPPSQVLSLQDSDDDEG